MWDSTRQRGGRNRYHTTTFPGRLQAPQLVVFFVNIFKNKNLTSLKAGWLLQPVSVTLRLWHVGCNSFDIVCVSVCASVTTLAGERTNGQTWFLAWRSSGRISRSYQQIVSMAFNGMGLRDHWCLHRWRCQGRNWGIRLCRYDAGCFQSVCSFIVQGTIWFMSDAKIYNNKIQAWDCGLHKSTDRQRGGTKFIISWFQDR